MTARRKRETRMAWIVVDSESGDVLHVDTTEGFALVWARWARIGRIAWRVIPVTYGWPPAPRKARKK